MWRLPPGGLRKFDDAPEKAQKRVFNAICREISREISRISEQHAALEKYLGKTISTGCARAYDPDQKRVWQV